MFRKTKISQVNVNGLLFSRVAPTYQASEWRVLLIRLEGLSATLRVVRCWRRKIAALDRFSVGIDLKLF
jgi:hypothetical protein